MALARILTVVRELILDERQYPEEQSARKRYLDGKYPELSNEEREDLAKITPDRLKLYTVSIFAGERNVLKSKFPITFDLLGRVFEKRGQPFDSYEFIREIHDVLPWRSALISDLVHNFSEYIRTRRQDLLSEWPGLEDVLRLEEITFAVPRAEADKNTPAEQISFAEVEKLSVERILELHGFIPSYVQAAAFEYRCPELFRHRRQYDEVPAGDVPEPRRSLGIVGRTAEYSTRWSTVSEEMFAAFSKMPRAVQFSIADLAEAFLSGVPDNRPEAESAQLFLADLLLLNCNGAILVSA